MTINYPKIIFLNLIIAILVYVLFSDLDAKTSIGGIILLGFVSSFFFKENLPGRFLKLMLINSLIFGLLIVIIAYSAWIVIDIIGGGNIYRFFVFLGFISLAFMKTVLFSFGYFVGIIPQGIYERLRKKEKKNSLGIGLKEQS